MAAEPFNRTLMRNRSPLLSYGVFSIATLVMLISLFGILVKLMAEQHVLKTHFRENLLWNTMQSEREALRLLQTLTDYVHGDTTVTRDEVVISFDILWSRLVSLRSGALGREYATIAGDSHAVDTAWATLQRLDPLLANLARAASGCSRPIQTRRSYYLARC